jgi:DNA-binding NtrC family response regulator
MNSRLVGTSSALCAIRQDIDGVARSNAKVLITGESGVGKDIVARLLHEYSGRPGPFVPINCAGVPESLLESELFGHVRGSYTGAHRDRRGWLQQPDGTVFLDEIGEMSLRMQALLLRFLENGEIQPIGSERIYIARNVRVIAATNRNLSECVANHSFREDLYYRLNVIHIVIPPLRERREDIAPLVAHFMEILCAEHDLPHPIVARETLENLTGYAWPGNVRELRNTVERLILCSRGGVISSVDLPPAIKGAVPPPTPPVELLYQRMIVERESFWTVVHEPFRSHDVTRDDLRRLVARGLKQTRGNYRALAALFNLPASDYKRFLGFLRKYGCDLPFRQFRLVPRPSEGVGNSANP